MKKSIYYFIAISFLIVVAVACSKSNEEDEQEPTPTCNTTNMSYTANVLPIIRNNCYGCHGNGTVTAGVNLDGHANLKTYADNGKLVAVISHAAGVTAMPYNMAKLANCDIEKIKAWVTSGAPNN